MYKTISLSFLLIGCCMLMSCKNSVYEKFHEVPEKRWNKNYPMEYIVNIEKAQKYNFTVAFSFLTFIQQKEIRFKLKITSPDQVVQSTQVLSIALKDEQGQPLGDVMGDYGDIELKIPESYELSQKGTYKFEVLQEMEPQEVGGITRIGLVINTAK